MQQHQQQLRLQQQRSQQAAGQQQQPPGSVSQNTPQQHNSQFNQGGQQQQQQQSQSSSAFQTQQHLNVQTPQSGMVAQTSFDTDSGNFTVATGNTQPAAGMPHKSASGDNFQMQDRNFGQNTGFTQIPQTDLGEFPLHLYYLTYLLALLTFPHANVLVNDKPQISRL